MGVLDEAIRQHLELKRAHGASEDELERQEAEALGPARRGTGSRQDQGAGEAAAGEAGGGRRAAAALDRERAEPGPPTGATVPADETGADEVTADEALDLGPPPPESAEPAVGPPGVFDVEELGPADARRVERGASEPAASPAEGEADLEEVEEEMLDAEEEAEEELAEELAGGAPLAGGADDADALEAEPAPRGDVASFEEDTLYRPPPGAGRGEAETDEYEVREDLLEDDLAVEDEPAEEELVEEEEELVEEEEDLLEEEEELEVEETEPPEGEHVPADEDLDLEDDLEAPEGGPPPGDAYGSEPGGAGAAAGDEPEADEDVLEETPDFLQETPEHERLWFEQKPPRDFDLDR